MNLGGNRTKLVSFTNLKAWQEAHKLVLVIYKVTENFPANDAFGLISQLQRSAVSVTSNIAEGFGRQQTKVKLHFYIMARGSVLEVQNQLLIAKDIGRLSEKQFDEIAEQTTLAHKLLHGLIRSTKKPEK